MPPAHWQRGPGSDQNVRIAPGGEGIHLPGEIHPLKEDKFKWTLVHGRG